MQVRFAAMFMIAASLNFRRLDDKGRSTNMKKRTPNAKHLKETVLFIFDSCINDDLVSSNYN